MQNACFELSSNRRDVWQGEGLAGLGRVRADWNEGLLTHAVVPAYLALLRHVATTHGPVPSTFALFPIARAPGIWHGVVAGLYTRVCAADPDGDALAWTAAGSQGAAGCLAGAWRRPAELAFADAEVCRDEQLRGALEAVQLLLCAMPQPVCAMLVDYLQRGSTTQRGSTIQRSNTSSSGSGSATGSSGARIVTPALGNISGSATATGSSGARIVTPALVRTHLRSVNGAASLAVSAAHAAVLLQYVMQDMVDDEWDSVRQLHGLRLLPTLDGRVHALRLTPPVATTDPPPGATGPSQGVSDGGFVTTGLSQGGLVLGSVEAAGATGVRSDVGSAQGVRRRGGGFFGSIVRHVDGVLKRGGSAAVSAAELITTLTGGGESRATGAVSRLTAP